MAGIKQDLPLIAGVLLMLTGVVYAGGTSNLPGIGNLDSPFSDVIDSDQGGSDLYDLSAQANLGSSNLGTVRVTGFTYQTQRSCNLCLSIAESSMFSFTGADNVRVTTTITNKDLDRIVKQNTKVYDELPGGESVVLQTQADNLVPGQYEVKYRVIYDPEFGDIEDWDNDRTKTYDVTVPRTR